LLSFVTGGSQKSTGVFYDDTWTRNLFAPGTTSCTGTPGSETQNAENRDVLVSGQIPLLSTIDPATLPLSSQCTPVFPHQFLQVNTIFNVAHAAGLYTAWSDKHPAYEIVRGPHQYGR
jgi:hypothetical protein